MVPGALVGGVFNNPFWSQLWGALTHQVVCPSLLFPGPMLPFSLWVTLPHWHAVHPWEVLGMPCCEDPQASPSGKLMAPWWQSLGRRLVFSCSFFSPPYFIYPHLLSLRTVCLPSSFCVRHLSVTRKSPFPEVFGCRSLNAWIVGNFPTTLLVSKVFICLHDKTKIILQLFYN